MKSPYMKPGTLNFERLIQPNRNTNTPSTTSAAAAPSLKVTSSIHLSVVLARKKLTIGCALQIGATTEAGA